ncbi:MAG: luxQ 3 [Cyanobacteria bacterium RYN_339]|nr:luxQ 3 [Cyanobacteria bacterium RYN_339]
MTQIDRRREGKSLQHLGGTAEQADAQVLQLTLELAEQVTDLEASLRLRDRAISASANGIVITDRRGPDNPIIYVNRAFERMTGYGTHEVLGQNCRFLQGADQDQVGLDAIRQAMREEREGHAELRNYRKDGSMFWNELFIAPVRDERGRVTHYVGVQNDVTARKQAENELERRSSQLEEAYTRLQALDKLRSNFFGLVSHELRTPLSSIVGFAEFLEDGVAGDMNPEQLAFVHEIQAGARRLEGLVDDLLDFARLEAGTFRLMPREADLAMKVREVIASFHPQAHAKRIELSSWVPAAPLVVCADHPRIGQALINLVNNALKFTPEGGRVAVSLDVEDDEIRITVADTGIGIAPEHVARLFDKFYQVEPTTTRSHGGAGLGLSISKALVEAHGGEIGLESVPGRGSTFWFTLQVATE